MTTETRTTSGGAYYATAVALREMASEVRSNEERARHVGYAVIEAALYEVGAALMCIAQAIEDTILTVRS